MKTILTLLRIIGYVCLSLFGLQCINVFLEWYPNSPFWMNLCLFSGLILLFILVLIERFSNKEDNYYSKNVEK